jgi:hypothetical protein
MLVGALEGLKMDLPAPSLIECDRRFTEEPLEIITAASYVLSTARITHNNGILGMKN